MTTSIPPRLALFMVGHPSAHRWRIHDDAEVVQSVFIQRRGKWLHRRTSWITQRALALVTGHDPEFDIVYVRQWGLRGRRWVLP